MKAPSETALVRQVLDYLRALKITCWRANTTGIKRRDKSGREFWAAPEVKGISDVIGALPYGGKLLALECKIGKNPLTDDQRSFLDAVEQAGGVALVVRDTIDGLRCEMRKMGYE